MFLEREIGLEELISLIDCVYDEIFIWDKDMRVVYANKACYRHYGLMPKDLIGKTLEELTQKEQLWWPSCVTDTREIREPVLQKQRTFSNIDIVTISVPIFDEAHNVKYVVQSVRDSDTSLLQSLSALAGVQEKVDNEKKCMVAESEIMKETMGYMDKVAKTKAPVLILGETGTGKSLFAKYIHEKSPRREKPFLSINMASLSPTVIESELFGYKKGAFTGANKEGKQGIFELANGGTLFLDEIGELPYEMQAKFLHVLQEEEIIPVGDAKPIKLDIRIICATNCDLQKMIEASRFRQDLFHRLNTFEVTIPPLRKRKEDIRALTRYYLNLYCEKYEKKVSCSESVEEVFQKYKWSGNVRELSNIIERSVIMAEGKSIEVTNLPESFFSIGSMKRVEEDRCSLMPFEEAVEAFEKKLILGALEKYKTSRKVAQALKISQTKANRLIRKYAKQGGN